MTAHGRHLTIWLLIISPTSLHTCALVADYCLHANKPDSARTVPMMTTTDRTVSVPIWGLDVTEFRKDADDWMMVVWQQGLEGESQQSQDAVPAGSDIRVAETTMQQILSFLRIYLLDMLQQRQPLSLPTPPGRTGNASPNAKPVPPEVAKNTSDDLSHWATIHQTPDGTSVSLVKIEKVKTEEVKKEKVKKEKFKKKKIKMEKEDDRVILNVIYTRLDPDPLPPPQPSFHRECWLRMRANNADDEFWEGQNGQDTSAAGRNPMPLPASWDRMSPEDIERWLTATGAQGYELRTPLSQWHAETGPGPIPTPDDVDNAARMLMDFLFPPSIRDQWRERMTQYAENLRPSDKGSPGPGDKEDVGKGRSGVSGDGDDKVAGGGYSHRLATDELMPA